VDDVTASDDTAGEPSPAWRRLVERRVLEPIAGEGLRDRKKRELRQRISDVATGMFLDRGFDEVRVSEVAEACDVSEKTVYNYFPTKESLLFDREDDTARQITEALVDRDDGRSVVESILDVLERDVTWLYDEWQASGRSAEGLGAVRRFSTLIEETPALTAALHGMTERLTQVAAEALAARAGVDPEEPEPQMAATIVMGLWRTQFQSMRRYADGVLDVGDARDAVLDELRRAARVAATGVSSFDAVVRSPGTKQQVKEAAEAADQARRQVVAAMKQARAAWREVMAEIQAHHAAQHEAQGRPLDRRSMQREMRAQQQELRAQIRQHQQELRQRQAELHREQMIARRSRKGR
jgi:AcrR family transcriptional regulator